MFGPIFKMSLKKINIYIYIYQFFFINCLEFPELNVSLPLCENLKKLNTENITIS